jgi:hypothetical protein
MLHETGSFDVKLVCSLHSSLSSDVIDKIVECKPRPTIFEI